MDLSKLPRLSKTETGSPPGSSSPSATTDPPAADLAPQSAAATSFCNHCGAPLRAGAKFCDSCGAPTGATYAAAAPQFYAEPGVGMEAWLSALIGLVLMLVG